MPDKKNKCPFRVGEKIVYLSAGVNVSGNSRSSTFSYGENRKVDYLFPTESNFVGEKDGKYLVVGSSFSIFESAPDVAISKNRVFKLKDAPKGIKVVGYDGLVVPAKDYPK